MTVNPFEAALESGIQAAKSANEAREAIALLLGRLAASVEHVSKGSITAARGYWLDVRGRLEDEGPMRGERSALLLQKKGGDVDARALLCYFEEHEGNVFPVTIRYGYEAFVVERMNDLEQVLSGMLSYADTGRKILKLMHQ